MDPITDLGVAVAGKVAASLLARIKIHVKYLYKFKDNLKALEDARVQLNNKRADGSRFVDDANRRLRDVGATVSQWQSDAEKLDQKAENLISRNNTSCLNLCSRYTSSKQAWELTQDINKNAESAPDFGTTFDRPISEGAKFNLEGSMDFDSRKNIISEVLEALKDDDVSMCSICGMGGVGKTTMAKNLVQIVEADGLLGKVAMVTVSQNPNFEQIQNEIIELLGLKTDESTMRARAKKLNDWLSNNRTLLILDDVWWQLHNEDFEYLGIPLTNKGCKIVVTSRNEDECKKMGSKRNFRLKVLDRGEAWNLFIRNADVESRNLQELAGKIVDECDGLPIAIVTVARALNEKPVGVWNDSLRKLQKSNLQGISGMERVYSRIKLSYDLLNDQEAQSCFRFCCLFPEDYDVPVEKLVFYGKGMELFEDVESLKEARDRVDLIIDKLKKSFLLLDGKGEGYVKLHDIVRDFAIWISSKDEYLVKCENEMNEWPEARQYEKCSAISIVCDTINDDAPVDFRFPNLKLLHLHFKKASGTIHAGLCQGMEELKVVDLQVPSLSPSLTVQNSLRTLLIDNGQQNDLIKAVDPNYFIEMLGAGDMKNLEIFSLSNTYFYDFPVEIKHLRNLRSLRFMNKVTFEYMPPGVLSNLVRLEELELPVDFNMWGRIERGGCRYNAALEELDSLPLTSLKISLAEGSSLAEKLGESITSFQILIGEDRFGFDSGINGLRLEGFNAYNVTVNWIRSLVRKCDSLMLVGDVTGEMIGNVRKLKHIMSQQSRGSNEFPCEYFSRLKTLRMKYMYSLEQIMDGPYLPNIQSPCFPNLTEIMISYCRVLKRVFPLSVATELRQLQRMEISGCEEMEEIFYHHQVDDGNEVQQHNLSIQNNASHKIVEKVEEREVDDVIVLPRLKILHLESMPKLRIIYNGNHAIECPSLEKLTMERCNSMEALSYGSFIAPKIKEFNLDGVRYMKNVIIKWLQESEIPEITTLRISRCHEMKYLVDATADSILVKAFFSRVAELSLCDMDNLEEVWHGPSLSDIQPPCFSILTEIAIYSFPKLKRVFPLAVATQLRQLQQIDISFCEEMEEIFYNTQTVEESTAKLPDDKEADNAVIFPQLKFVSLTSLPKLRIFYDGNHAMELPSLEEFEIDECNKIEALSNGSFKAPKLKEIEIDQKMYPCGEDLNTIVRETLNIIEDEDEALDNMNEDKDEDEDEVMDIMNEDEDNDNEEDEEEEEEEEEEVVDNVVDESHNIANYRN